MEEKVVTLNIVELRPPPRPDSIGKQALSALTLPFRTGGAVLRAISEHTGFDMKAAETPQAANGDVVPINIKGRMNHPVYSQLSQAARNTSALE